MEEKFKHGDLVQLSQLIRKYLKEIAIKHPEYTPNTLAFAVAGTMMKISKGTINPELVVSMIRYQTQTDM